MWEVCLPLENGKRKSLSICGLMLNFVVTALVLHPTCYVSVWLVYNPISVEWIKKAPKNTKIHVSLSLCHAVQMDWVYSLTFVMENWL